MPLTILAKCFILDVLPSSEYAPEIRINLFVKASLQKIDVVILGWRYN